MKKNKFAKWLAGGLVLALLVGMTGCGKAENGAAQNGSTQNETKKEVSIDEIVSAVKEAYGEEYVPDTQLDEEAIKNLYGVSADLYQEAYAEMPAISAHVDTFIAIHCKEGKQEEVVAALEKYQENLKNDMLQYPMNQVIIQASRIIQKDGYVFFVMLGGIPNEVSEQGDDAILKKAEENNDIAQQAIEALF